MKKEKLLAILSVAVLSVSVVLSANIGLNAADLEDSEVVENEETGTVLETEEVVEDGEITTNEESDIALYAEEVDGSESATDEETNIALYAEEVANSEIATTEEADIALYAEEVDGSEVIKNDETGIPDVNLYKAVLEQCDSNGDRILTKDEAAECEILDLWGCGIENLQGIQYLENVTTLVLNDNHIRDISALSDLTNVSYLHLSNNQISDVSALSNLINLDDLFLDDNQISNISALSSLINLNALSLDSNHIRDISALSSLTNVSYLYLSNNQISDISALSSLIDLKDLSLDNNQISDISVLSNLTNMSYLSLDNNQISSISMLTGLTNLYQLYLDNNQIRDISALSSLTNMWSLSLDNNQISDISVLSNLTKVSYLSLGNNQISDISALSNLTNMRRLSLDDNQISDIGVLSNLTNLEDLSLDNNQISDISALSILTKVSYLYLSNNQIRDISVLSSLTNLTYLVLSNNQIKDISALSSLTKVWAVYLDNNQISNLPSLEWNDFMYLDLRYNNISDLNVMKNYSFEYESRWGVTFDCYYGSDYGAGEVYDVKWRIAEGNPVTREHEIAMLPSIMLNTKVLDDNGNVVGTWLEAEGFAPANILEDTVISSDEFVSLLEANQTEDIVIKSGPDVLFIFKKDTMKAVDGMDNYDFSVVVSKDFSKVTGLPAQVTSSNFVARIDYKYSGKLPATASIQIYVGKDLAGQKLYYSQLMSDTSVALVQAATVDAEGYIIVTQDHCSSYIITKEALNAAEATPTTEASTTVTNGNTPATGDSSMPWLFGTLAVSALAVLIALKRKAFVQ